MRSREQPTGQRGGDKPAIRSQRHMRSFCCRSPTLRSVAFVVACLLIGSET
jgi:hypothetical protein